MRVYSLTVAAILVGGAARGTAAQGTWSPFVAFSSAPSGGPLAPSGTSSIVFEPGAVLESTRGSLLARWSTAFDQHLPQLGDADLASRMRIARAGPFESSIYASGHYDRGVPGSRAAANATFRLQLGSTSPTRGVQFGLGADSWRSSGDEQLVPASTASAWIRRFGLSFTAEVTAHSLPGARLSSSSGDTSTTVAVIDYWTPFTYFDTLGDTLAQGRRPHYSFVPKPGSNRFDEARTFGETRLRVSGTILSMGLDAQLGRTMATRGAARNFGSIILTHWLSSSVAVTGGMVVQPPEPGSFAGRSGGLLGIRLASGPRAMPSVVNAPKAGVMSVTVRVNDGHATLEVRAPGAGHVELSGDFTQWLPVALERAGGDRWTLTTALSPGLHRLLIRVDGGAWVPPPGLPQTVDPYEGTVGVIVADR